MTPARPPLPLAVKLPLLISGLLLLAIASLSWAAYREVRRSTLAAAYERLERVTGDLAARLTASGPQRLREARETAAELAVSSYLRGRGPEARSAASAVLERVSSRDPLNSGGELWGGSGERLLAAGHIPSPMDAGIALEWAAASAAPPGGVIGPLRLVHDSLFFPVVAPVRAGGPPLGYVVIWRRVSTSPQTVQQITALIGSDAVLLVGNASGDLWTDLVHHVDPPPVNVSLGGHFAYERPGRGAWLAHAVPLAGTPWVLTIEMSRERVLAGVRAFLRQIALLAIGLLALGMGGAWAVSRRITTPLDKQSAAAQARFRAAVDSAPNGMLLVDRTGAIVLINRAGEQIFGYGPGELLGVSIERLVPTSHRDRHPGLRGAFLRAPETRAMGAGRELFGVRKNGTEIPVEIGLTPVESDDGLLVLASVVDVTTRKAAEALLHESAERYHRTLDSMVEGCQIIGRDERYVYVNDAAARHGRKAKEELLGHRMRDAYPGIETTEIFASLQRCLREGGFMHMENQFTYPDGSTAWFEVRMQPVPEGVFILSIDITERARAEQIRTAVYRIAEASQSAASLESLLKSVHEIIGTLMPAKNFYIALYDEANDLITFPYFVDEVDSPPPPRRPTAGLTEHVLKTGKALLSRHELGPAASEAERSWIGAPSVDWLGVPLKQGDRTIGVIAVQTYTAGVRYEERDKEMLQYVSTQVAAAIERKRAEEALRDSEERFRALVEHSGDAIALLDHDGRVMYASQSSSTVLGRDPQSVVGTNALDLLHPDDVPEMRRALATLAGSPGRAVGVRSRFRHADGTWRDGEGTVANRLHDPVVRAIVFNYRDVTDRQRLETQLRQAQKMEAVGRLAGGIAHDFNNVLTAVFGYVDLLREDLPPDSTAQGDLAEVRKAAERAASLTRQLLAFSRQQVLEPVVLNPNELIEDFDKMLRRMIGEDVELRLTLRKDVGNVRADPGQLDQVLMNLVVNARDAMPQGGTLIIETANADLTEQYAELHQPVVPGPYVMLAVSDTGMGMTPDVRARIFEPFFTTKERGKGTGLGLSTVYGIVKQSGGYIWAYSEPGRGTTFKIYLPRVDAPAEGLHPAREPRSVTGTETILVAEDDAILRPLAKGVLEKLGYRVLFAENAAGALAVAREHQGPIHLLVADVVMPGASGRELARRLGESRPDTKVLYVSGYTDDAIVHHGMLEPGLNFLQKPFTPAALARRVRDVLDGRKGP